MRQGASVQVCFSGASTSGAWLRFFFCIRGVGELSCAVRTIFVLLVINRQVILVAGLHLLGLLGQDWSSGTLFVLASRQRERR